MSRCLDRIRLSSVSVLLSSLGCARSRVAEIAEDLGISDSCLRNWMAPGRHRRRPTRAACRRDERDELAELRRELRGHRRWRTRSSSGRRPTSPGRTSSQNDLHLHRPSLLGSAGGGVLPGDEGVDLRVLRVASPAVQRPRLRRRGVDQHHRRHPPHEPRAPMARPRVHAELRLGVDTRCCRKRVERLMRQAGVAGIYRRRGRGCTRRDGARPADDLVEPTPSTRTGRPAVGDGRHRAPHRRGQGVPGGRPRRVQPPGRRLVDRRPHPLPSSSSTPCRWRSGGASHRRVKTVAHSDHGSQYTSWAFGRRLRGAGLLGSMGTHR